MYREIRLFCVIALTALAFSGAFAFNPEIAKDAKSFDGSFVWERSDKNIDGDVKAVFTPSGEGEWTVSFHFEWEDGPHVYKGTAKGSLTDGTLEGEVENDNPERKSTFRFRGTVTDGSFKGTHVVLSEDGEKATGSLTMKATN